MKKVSLGKLVGGILGAKDAPRASLWRPEGKPYPRLLQFDPIAEGLNGQEGIYAVWHLGVRPQWLRVGAAADLGAALAALARAPWIVAHQNNAGVFVAWAFPPADQYGMVHFLTARLKPAFQSEIFACDRPIDPALPPIVCALPPGTK